MLVACTGISQNNNTLREDCRYEHGNDLCMPATKQFRGTTFGSSSHLYLGAQVDTMQAYFELPSGSHLGNGSLKSACTSRCSGGKYVKTMFCRNPSNERKA